MVLEVGYAHYTIAVLYFLTFVALVWYQRQLPTVGRRYTAILLVVLFVSGIGALLQGAGIGTYDSAVEADSSIPQFVDDTIAYATLFGLTGVIAGASARMSTLLAALSGGSRIAIEVGGLSETLIGLGLLISFSSYGARIYLLWRPVWRTAQSTNPRRQLLFRKARNILMFLIGVNILVGLIGASGLFTNFVQQMLLVYVDFFIRIGFVGFLVSNFDVFWVE